MIACGGGKNGSGSQANLAVATSHKVRNKPSASSHGARCCNPLPTRSSDVPATVTAKIAPAMTKAEIASAWVRDQSPRSSHHRHENPKPIQARLASRLIPFAVNDAGSDSGRPANAAPSSADCGNPIALDTEYVDINPLRKLCRIGALFEYGNELQVIGIGLELLLEHRSDRMVVMGVISNHRLQILKACCLGRVGLERSGGLVRIL